MCFLGLFLPTKCSFLIFLHKKSCTERIFVYLCSPIWEISQRKNNMVVVAQLVRALVCGTRGRGFESHLPPQKPMQTHRLFFCARWDRRTAAHSARQFCLYTSRTCSGECINENAGRCRRHRQSVEFLACSSIIIDADAAIGFYGPPRRAEMGMHSPQGEHNPIFPKTVEHATPSTRLTEHLCCATRKNILRVVHPPLSMGFCSTHLVRHSLGDKTGNSSNRNVTGQNVPLTQKLDTLAPYPPHVSEQNHIHQQGVDDCRDGHFAAVEDERGGGNGNGLGSVLHPHLNYYGTAYCGAKA